MVSLGDTIFSLVTNGKFISMGAAVLSCLSLSLSPPSTCQPNTPPNPIDLGLFGVAKMTPFMRTLQELFLQTTSFPSNNTYNSLNVTPTSLLSFPTPTGLIVTLSSLSTPNFATSYVLHSTGNLRGSISYLYTTPNLKVASSESAELRNCFESYQIPSILRNVGTRRDWEIWKKGERIDTRDVLLYGMMKVPEGVINGLYLRRMSPARLLKIMAVSEAGLRTDPVDGNGVGAAKKPKGNVLASIVTDRGKYSYEGLYSTAGGLVGLRGLWNFGWDPNVEEVENQTGRLSIGGEVYYGIFNKSGGGKFHSCPYVKVYTDTVSSD